MVYVLPNRKNAVKALVGVSGLLASALVMAPNGAVAERLDPASPAGSLVSWGATEGVCTNPASGTVSGGPYRAFDRSENDGEALGINAAGLLTQPVNTLSSIAIPAALANQQVKAVSVTKRKGAAVTSDGAVHIWGASNGFATGTFTAATLGAKAVDVSIGILSGVVLLEDGTVGTFTGFGYTHVAGLEDVAEVLSDGSSGYTARITGGGLRSFVASTGDETSANIPAAVRGDELADPVASFASTLAVTQAGVVHSWAGNVGSDTFPTVELDGKVIDVATLTDATTDGWRAALTDENEVVVWGPENAEAECTAAFTELPEAIEGKGLRSLVDGGYQFSVIASDPLAVNTAPSIAGTAEVGSTLTGTPATFTGSPDLITNRWFADDAPIEGTAGGATTYTLTAAELGKNITFKSTATRGADAPVVSTSASVGPVQPPPAKIASVTAVAAPTRSYGTAGTATVTVTNTGSRAVSGTVTLTGAGPAQTKTLAGGKAAFALPKSLAATAYTLKASYSGNSGLNPSSKTARYTVAKAKSKAPTFKATKRPTSKKAGKATVTVSTLSGLAKASGKVTVTLKKGSSSKKVSGTLSGGKRTIKLPKLKKGTWKVTVSYAGDKNYVAQKSKTYSLKIKK